MVQYNLPSVPSYKVVQYNLSSVPPSKVVQYNLPIDINMIIIVIVWIIFLVQGRNDMKKYDKARELKKILPEVRK